MEIFGQLAGGFATALQPINMLMLFVAIVLGLVIGVLPGLGGTSGVAILLPISLFIKNGALPGSNEVTAIIFLAGIYWGALFGGVITSILFNIPGEPWAVVLLFDGFPLAKSVHGRIRVVDRAIQDLVGRTDPCRVPTGHLCGLRARLPR